MGVGVDANYDTLLFRHLTISVGEIETDRMRVHFQKAASRSCMPDQARHVHIVRGSFIDQSPAGVCQDCEIRAIHGSHDPFRLFLPGESEMAVDCADHQIEPAQVFIREIKAPVLQNVHLDPL